MKYPQLKVQSASRQMVDTFRGYNHNLRIGEGEFFDMKNMTSDFYPVLSPRRKRGFYAKPASPQGLIAKEKVCYVDGSSFVIGDTVVEMGLSVKEADCPKRLVSMGAYVIILPDKMYINTVEPEDRGSIEAEYTSESDVSFTLCTVNAEEYKNATVAADAPENPENQDLWVDTSATPHVLKKYSTAMESWVQIATTYVKISAPGLGAKFDRYDGVTVSGVKEELKSLNGTMVVWDRGEDYIVVVGIIDAAAIQTAEEGSITVARRMPNMDYIIESENRLWGCRYGTAANGEMVNEIYASKLGDFKNWNCFMGLSTDSYAASCGTDGPFTGAITHMGYPLLFKENCIHKVYGNYPANFQIQTTACRGVQKGSHDSLAIVNETLFYKAVSGICAYDGSLPQEASYALGNTVYRNAVGGAHGNKYYVSMEDAAGAWHLFVYDMAKSLWHKEDNLHAQAFCSLHGELYAIDGENRNILTMLGSGAAGEECVEWMVGVGSWLGWGMTIRMAVETGSVIDVYARYDLSGEWEHLCNIRGTNLRSFSVPIRPRRCDWMKLRFVGTGGAKIYSNTKTTEQGSERS